MIACLWNIEWNNVFINWEIEVGMREASFYSKYNRSVNENQ